MLSTLLALTLAAAAPGALIPDTTDVRPGVAVLPFTNGGSFGRRSEDLAAMEVGVQQMLITELAQNSALRVVERSRLREILEEQNQATAGRVDPATAAEVGKLVGARYVVTGVFMDLNGDFRMDGRVVDVQTGEVVGTEQVRGRRRHVYRLLMALADSITHGVDLPPLPRRVAAERARRNVPDQATLLLSRAQILQDRGRSQDAIELYREIIRRFPDYTEARDQLRQLEGG